MVENAEASTGATIITGDEGCVDRRVTRVGRVLRQTHLDKIPLAAGSIVSGMSVVGLYPERPALDFDIQGHRLTETLVRQDRVDWRRASERRDGPRPGYEDPIRPPVRETLVL